MNPQDLETARQRAREARDYAALRFGAGFWANKFAEEITDVCDLVDALVGEVEGKFRRVDELEEALRYVSEQAPEHIGNEPCLVSPGGFYKARLALSGGERKEGEA